MISTYAILLCFIFIIEIGAGLLAYFYKDQLAEHLGRNLQSRLRDEYGLNNDTTIAVDHLQSRRNFNHWNLIGLDQRDDTHVDQ